MAKKQDMAANAHGYSKLHNNIEKSSKADTKVIRACKASISMQSHGVGELKIAVNKVLKSDGVRKSDEHKAKIITYCSTGNNEGSHLSYNKCKAKIIICLASPPDVQSNIEIEGTTPTRSRTRLASTSC